MIFESQRRLKAKSQELTAKSFFQAYNRLKETCFVYNRRYSPL